MKQHLSTKEINEMLSKLRLQYDDYATQYSKSFFNKQEFENRYLNALHSGMDIQNFILAEINFFEQLKIKWHKIEQEEYIRREKPFTKKVEQYIDEWEKQWRKYNPLFTETDISDEAQHFLGSLNQFYNESWLLLVNTIDKKNLTLLNTYNNITIQFQKYVNPLKDKLPYEVEVYQLNIHKAGLEQANMVFLKKGAALTKELKQFIEKMELQNNFSSNQQLPHELNEAQKRKLFLQTQQQIEQIIADFRFKSFI